MTLVNDDGTTQLTDDAGAILLETGASALGDFLDSPRPFVTRYERRPLYLSRDVLTAISGGGGGGGGGGVILVNDDGTTQLVDDFGNIIELSGGSSLGDLLDDCLLRPTRIEPRPLYWASDILRSTGSLAKVIDECLLRPTMMERRPFASTLANDILGPITSSGGGGTFFDVGAIFQLPPPRGRSS